MCDLGYSHEASRRWLVLSSLVLIYSSLAVGKVTTVELNRGTECYSFLSSFCFSGGNENGGTMKIELTYPASSRGLHMLFFFGESDAWSAVHSSDTACFQKIRLAAYGNRISLPWVDRYCLGSEDPSVEGCISTFQSRIDIVVGDKIRYEGEFDMTRADDTYVYVAIVFTNRSFAPADENTTEFVLSDRPLRDIRGMLHMINVINGDRTEFSVDEFGLLHVASVALGTEIVLVLVAGYVSYLLRREGKLHYTVLMLDASLALYTAGLALYTSHFYVYASNGIGLPGLETAAFALFGCSDATLLGQLILLAHGWTVTRRKLRRGELVKIAIVLAAYTTFVVSFVCWYRETENEETEKFAYESPPGYSLIVSRILLWFWFLKISIASGKRHWKRAAFFGKLSLGATIWFLSLPVLLASSFLYDVRYRKRSLRGGELTYTFFAHVAMVWLYRPKRCCNQDSFPFQHRSREMRRRVAQVVAVAGDTHRGAARVGARTRIVADTMRDVEALVKIRMLGDELRRRTKRARGILDLARSDDRGLPGLRMGVLGERPRTPGG